MLSINRKSKLEKMPKGADTVDLSNGIVSESFHVQELAVFDFPTRVFF